MKKCINNILLVSIFTMIIFTLTACGKVDYSKFIGTWEYTDEGYGATYIFNEDKTGTYTLTAGEESDVLNFTYKIDSKIIYITYENDTDVFENKYKLENEKLIIEDSFGEKMEFIKK